jgi:hypothetical protein
MLLGALCAASLGACARPVAVARGGEPTPLRADACLAPNAIRWERDREQQRTLRVWLGGDAVTRDRRPTTMRSHLRAAMSEWNALGLPLQLVLTTSRADAEIRVEVIDQFPLDPTLPGSAMHGGLTHLQYTRSGHLAAAEVYVAEMTPRGMPYSGEDWRAILLHELGHALGLPHARLAFALMAMSPVVSSVTPADAATARELYVRPRCPATLATASPAALGGARTTPPRD